MAVRPLSSGLPELSVPPEDRTNRVVQPGDTLSGIARELQQQGVPGTTAELVRTLARLNGIANPDRIEVGQVLTLPGGAMTRPESEDRVVDLAQARPRLATPPPFLKQPAEPQARLANALFRLLHQVLPEARPPARAADGTPLFRQGDPAWRTERLGASGEGPTLAHAGCAVTACAMALSRLGGRLVTPDALVRHLRGSGGFQGPLVDWSVAGSAIPGGPRASPDDLDCSRLDRELDSGRPVLLRVVHDVQGRSQQHWICLTGRDARTGQYTANDPATGRATALTREGGALASAGGEPVRYASDGRMVTFGARPPGQA
jgi:hypothetical protein